MTTMSPTKGKHKADVHYVHAGIPCVVEENFEVHYNDPGNRAHAELLQDQGQCGVRCAAAKSSKPMNLESQFALDEAVAMALQELENQLTVTYMDESETNTTETANGESTSTGTSVQAARQDDVDPDSMTYEELQSLGETIGTQNRGLSDELISYLPSSRYKTGFFSRKDKLEE